MMNTLSHIVIWSVFFINIQNVDNSDFIAKCVHIKVCPIFDLQFKYSRSVCNEKWVMLEQIRYIVSA